MLSFHTELSATVVSGPDEALRLASGWQSEGGSDGSAVIVGVEEWGSWGWPGDFITLLVQLAGHVHTPAEHAALDKACRELVDTLNMERSQAAAACSPTRIAREGNYCLPNLCRLIGLLACLQKNVEQREEREVVDTDCRDIVI